MNGKVEHPAHYNKGGIEAFDVMRAFGLTDFWLGNALKYLLRCKHKGAEIEDLKKCAFYINEYIKSKGDSDD